MIETDNPTATQLIKKKALSINIPYTHTCTFCFRPMYNSLSKK